jgi:hypothetical protein
VVVLMTFLLVVNTMALVNAIWGNYWTWMRRAVTTVHSKWTCKYQVVFVAKRQRKWLCLV